MSALTLSDGVPRTKLPCEWGQVTSARPRVPTVTAGARSRSNTAATLAESATGTTDFASLEQSVHEDVPHQSLLVGGACPACRSGKQYELKEPAQILKFTSSTPSARGKVSRATERLARHQRDSAPVMQDLKAWIEDELEQKRVEPNSELGKAY